MTYFSTYYTPYVIIDSVCMNVKYTNYAYMHRNVWISIYTRLYVCNNHMLDFRQYVWRHHSWYWGISVVYYIPVCMCVFKLASKYRESFQFRWHTFHLVALAWTGSFNTSCRESLDVQDRTLSLSRARLGLSRTRSGLDRKRVAL